MPGKRSTHSPKFCQAVIGNGYASDLQLPDQDLLYINRISAVQTDLHNADHKQNQPVPIIRSVIQTLTLNTFERRDREIRQPVVYHTTSSLETTPLESVSVISPVPQCRTTSVIIPEKESYSSIHVSHTKVLSFAADVATTVGQNDRLGQVSTKEDTPENAIARPFAAESETAVGQIGEHVEGDFAFGNLTACNYSENNSQSTRISGLSEMPYYQEEISNDSRISISRAVRADWHSPYINCDVNGFPAIFLVDSGATHTLLSKSAALEIGLLTDEELNNCKQKGKTATGSPIYGYGSHQITLTIGTAKLVGFVEITDISENGLLGMDFLAAFGCTLDLNTMNLRIHEQSIPLVNKDGKRLACACFTSEEIIVKPRSEHIISLTSQVQFDPGGLVEPNYPVISQLGLLGSRCIIENEPVIRVANVSSVPIQIVQNSPIAFLTDPNVLLFPSQTVNKTDDITCHHSAITNEECALELPDHVQSLYDGLPDHVSPGTREKMKQLLIKYQDVFSRDAYDMGYCDWVPHEIRLKPGTIPIRQAPYRVGYHQSKEIEKHVQELLDKNLIEKTVSPWSAPVLLISKKDGTSRFVQDYRKLNQATYIPSQPLPRTDDCLEALRGSTLFSTFDLLSGYWQCSLSPEAKEMVAFCTKSGVYTWKVLGMGLCGAPATFERLMEQVMDGLQWESLLVYLDDVIVFSADEETHLTRLDQMLSRMKQANLKIKVSKTHLLQTEVEFLGHVVNKDGIHTDPSKVKAIQEVPSPTSLRHLRSFLGFTGYYRKFIDQYADTAAPLFSSLKQKKKKFIWTDKDEEAFQSLKTKLATYTSLSYPDWCKQFILDTDCSGIAMGAVLAQLDDENNEKPIAFFSKKLSDSQRKYSITKQEMLALVCAIRHFHTYLYGTKFKCRVDHHSLIWLRNLKNPQGILARWLETLGSYDFEVEHRPGKQHINADALTRLPFPEGNSAAESEVALAESETTAFKIREVDTSVGITTAELVESQEKDQHLSPIIACLKQNTVVSPTDCKQYSRITRYYLGKLPSMKLKDDLLLIHDPVEDSDKIVVPENFQQKLIQSFHELDHAGMDRTESRIKLYYFWFNMQSDVRTYVQTCESCQKSKMTRARVNHRNLSVGTIMDQISLDFIGPISRTVNDNTHILVAVEHFSRWAEAYPLAQPDAISCAQSLHNGIFSRFGYCRIIHSDKGSAFISAIMKELSELGQCRQTFSARYHPMGNSYAERVIGTISSNLRTCTQHTGLEWDELLDVVMMAYRATPHSSTGFTPNMVMLGREVRLPAVLAPPVNPVPVTEYVRNLNSKLKFVYSKCLGQPTMTTDEYDHLIHKPFKEGDLVWVQRLKSNTNRPGKLEAKYTGPCPILKVLDFDTYVLEESGREVIEHHSRLKRARIEEGNLHVQDQQQDSSVNENEPDAEVMIDESHLPHGLPEAATDSQVDPNGSIQDSNTSDDRIMSSPIPGHQDNHHQRRRTRRRRPRWMDDYFLDDEVEYHQ